MSAEETLHLRHQRDFYDRHYTRRAAAVRDQVGHPLLSAFFDRLAVEILDASDRRPLRVLEGGCGEGLLAAALHRQAARRGIDLAYTGSDVTDAAVVVARELAGGEYIVGDAVEVTAALPPGSFDVMVLKNLLHHLDDPTALLVAAARAVGPKGRIVMCEAKLGLSQSMLFNLLAFRREKYFFRGLGRNLRRPVEEAGLAVVSARPFNVVPYELLFAIRQGWFRRLMPWDNPSLVQKTDALDEYLARRAPWLATYLLAVTRQAAPGEPSHPS